MNLAETPFATPHLTLFKSRQYYKKLSDVALIRACQRHEHEAFDEVVSRYQRSVYRMLHQLAPDWDDHCDMVQEVYIRVWRSIHTLRNPQSFKTWLHQIVTNIFYDQLRKRPKQTLVSLEATIFGENGDEEYVRELPDSSRSPEEMIQRKELAQAIDSAFDHLPEQFRTAIVLRDIEGLSYEQIAILTKTEVGTVKSRISRARGRVQESVTHKFLDCA